MMDNRDDDDDDCEENNGAMDAKTSLPRG